MPLEPQTPIRVGALIGRQVHDRTGQLLGRIADLETHRDPHGRERVTAAIVTSGRWGRLLGYERDERTGPWPLEHLARYVLRRHTARIAWTDLNL